MEEMKEYEMRKVSVKRARAALTGVALAAAMAGGAHADTSATSQNGWGIINIGGGFGLPGSPNMGTYFGIHSIPTGSYSPWGVGGGATGVAPMGGVQPVPGWGIINIGGGFGIGGGAPGVVPVGGVQPMSGWGLANLMHPRTFGLINIGGGFAMPGMVAAPQGGQIAIHCTFGENTMLLAQSVTDCETAGGSVHEDLKATQDSNG
jgi:hypothetical protein